MDWGNVFVRSKKTSSTGAVESIEVELHLDGDFKKTSKKVHWLAVSPSAPLVPVNLLDYDYLITKKKIEEDDNWEDFINPKTEFVQQALADANVAELKKGDIIQLERRGYYILDREVGVDGKEGADFIFVPDGKATSVALKAEPAAADVKPTAPVKASAKATKATSTAAPVQQTARKLPDPAPDAPVSTTLLSNGSSGFEIPVKTKMYHVDPLVRIARSKDIPAPAD